MKNTENKNKLWTIIVVACFAFMAFTFFYVNIPSRQTSSSNNDLINLTNVIVNTSMEQRGNFMIINGKIKNHEPVDLQKDLKIYLKDGHGNKQLIDIIYVNLGPKEIGNFESNIKISKLIGPPPYNVVTEWR